MQMLVWFPVAYSGFHSSNYRVRIPPNIDPRTRSMDYRSSPRPKSVLAAEIDRKLFLFPHPALWTHISGPGERKLVLWL